MENDFYKEFARFRVLTMLSIKSKRSSDLIFRDIDKEMARIANSISKSYTLGQIRTTGGNELYRPYRYFDVVHTDIKRDIANKFNMRQAELGHRAALNVTIRRNDFKLEINDENWTKFWIWATKWNVSRPKTLEECEWDEFYTRWW